MKIPPYPDDGDVPISTFIRRAEEVGVFAYDIETTSLDCRNGRIKCISLYIPAHEGRPHVRALYPFVRDTIEVNLFRCLKCQFMTYDSDDCKRTADRLMLCPKCMAMVEPMLVSVRDPLPITETFEQLQPMFANRELLSVGYGMKFDDPYIRLQSGVEPTFQFLNRRADAILAVYMQDERYKQYGLKQTTKRFFNVELDKYSQFIKKKGYDPSQHQFSFMTDKGSKPLGVYAMDDAEYHYKCFAEAMKRMREQDPKGRLERIFWKIEMGIQPIIEEMEQTGVRLDWKHLKEVSTIIRGVMKEVRAQIQETVDRLGWDTPYNPNSPDQTSDLLFNPPEKGGLGLPTDGLEPGKKGKFPTGEVVIKHFAPRHPVVKQLLRWRSLDTLRSGFADKLYEIGKKNGRVFAKFNQTGTVIGRLSSSDPVNLMNQPRAANMFDINGDREMGFIRYAFCAHPPEEKSDMLLFGADYGQIELRVAAHLANEPTMIEVYNNPICPHNCEAFVTSFAKNPEEPRCEHVDLHTRTAVAVDVPRNPLAKNLNFGLLYRMGAPKFCVYASLFDEHGEPRVGYARGIIRKWFNAYSGIKAFHAATEAFLKANNWVSYTLTGRRRRLDQDKDKNEYTAVTQGIQFRVSGSAQDIMKLGMIAIRNARQERLDNAPPAERKQWKRCRFLIQVHDEILMQGPDCLKHEIKDMIETSMKGAANLAVPLAVNCKWGRTWNDVH